MSIRSIRLLVLGASLGFMVLGGGLLVWSVIYEDSQFTAEAESVIPASTQEKIAPRRPTQADFAVTVQRRYQSPLFDPPPPPPPPTPKPKPKPPPPQVKLMATMLEPTGNQAIFTDSQGTLQIVTVGDKVSDGTATAEVVEIRADGVVIKFNDELVTLQLPQ